MKVGIITFHWATNYGAILQAYALQEALRLLDYDVEIINYKPRQYDDSLWSFIRYGKFLNIKQNLLTRKKEKKLVEFREQYLFQTQRYHSLVSLQNRIKDFDVLITGSDQVLNPSFLKHGERNGSTAYFLDFGGSRVKRYAYAASFGVTDYPSVFCQEVKSLVNKFVAVSTRENSGIEIFKKMGMPDAVTVCDPTLLHKSVFYDTLIAEKEVVTTNTTNVSAYFLRGREQFISNTLAEIDAQLIYNESLTGWIDIIRQSKHVVTNSYHGMLFCLIYHIPFTVVLTTKENIGMNDRFYTILNPLKLTHRIVSENEFRASDIVFESNWNDVEVRLNKMRTTGWNFLKKI